MLTLESVKNRLDREQPLTFLEFNYMLLQAYDYYHLNKDRHLHHEKTQESVPRKLALYNFLYS